MNTTNKLPPFLHVICRDYYRGKHIYQDGEGVKIIVGKKELTFRDVKEAQAFIDKNLNKIVLGQ